MKKFCAWCGNIITASGPEAEKKNPITHGLCPECAYHLFAQVGMPLRTYLDGLRVPVIVVDETGRVQTASQEAAAMLGKAMMDIEGQLGGDVFECVYARLPEGCGQTVHCKACTIRRTVTQTYQTTKSQTRVPTFLNRHTGKGVQRTEFLISTERVNEMVVLRIDEVGHC